MAWTLAELSKIETDVLRKSVVDTLIMESNVLEMLPFETIGQLSTGIIKVQDLPSVGFRRINDGYEESTGTFEQRTESIALLGGDIDTDKAIARAKNTVADARAIQQQLMLKAIAYTFNDVFINGDSGKIPTGNKGLEFDGLKKRVDAAYAEGYTDQKIQLNDATVLATAAKMNDFVDKLDELIYSVAGHQPDYLLMNAKTLGGVRGVLRRLGLLDTTKDMFDRNIDVYRGAKMVAVSTKADGRTDIIGLDEGADGDGTGDGRTSIYAVKFGVGDMTWGIQQYPLEVEDLGQLETKPVYRTRIDFPVGLATVDPRSIARLYGFKFATS